MSAKIFVSNLLDARVKAMQDLLTEHQFSLNHPDLHYIDDEEKLGVEQTKDIRRFLSIKPFSAKGRAVVLESAHKLTEQAQNSLLKTLEEPPENALILLGVEKEDQLISTVLSRCQIIRVQMIGDSDQETMSHDLASSGVALLTGMTLEERFSFIEKNDDKDQLLKDLLIFYQKQLHQGTKLNIDFLKDLQQAEEWTQANGNIRAILEYLMLKMPKKIV